ncbi:hypothetical protein COOONC_03319 [Cooperia oncophora]
MVIAFINVAIICNWIGLLYVVLCPTPLVIQYTRKYISENYGIDATRKAFLGLIWKYITPLKFTLVIETFIVILALGTVGALCAWKIDRCLRVNAMSPQTKKIHRHMLLMLILQTVCPALLLNGPICAAYMLLFIGADSPSVLSYIMGLFVSSFTIFSPAIVLVFMKDYRNYILIALRLRKPSQITKVTASEPRSAR